jgi:replicative DNA helicase
VLYSAEAEKAVLGCMMAQPAEGDRTSDGDAKSLSKEDFFVPAHQEIFGRCGRCTTRAQAIDVMTIHQWLTDRKMAEAVGSPGILAELLVGFATHLNVGSYIRSSRTRACCAACNGLLDHRAGHRRHARFGPGGARPGRERSSRSPTWA